MPDGDVPWLLIERYCARACTPEETAALESWLANDPQRRLLVERMRVMFGDTPPVPDRAEIEREWARLVSMTEQRPDRRLTAAALIAAGLLALLGIAWYIAKHGIRP